MAQPGVCVEPVYGRRIVFYGAAEDISEPTLLQLFSRHGDVTGLFVVRSALGLPCGCGYVTMASAEQASAAVTALVGTSDCAEPGTKLGLLIIQTGSSSSPAHDSQPGSPTEAGDRQDSRTCSQQSPRTKDSRSVFFTKVPPTVTAHQLIQLFTSCGEVLHLELFTPWPGAKISKGCGLVEFASPDAAAAAVHSLHHAFTWPHSHSPLIVEWVDSNRQSANRAHKARSAAAAAAAASEQGSVRRTLTAPSDGRKLPAGMPALGGFMAHPGQPGTAMYAAAMQHQQQLARLQQQHLNSHSCPLPQGSWAAGGNAGMAGGIPWNSPSAFSNSAVLPTVAVQGGSDGSAGYRTPGSSSLDGSTFSHQQAAQRDGHHLWWPMQQQQQQPQRNGYEALNPVPAPLSSTSSNLGQPSPPAYSHSLETSLQACSAAGYSGELCEIGSFPVSGSALGTSPTLRCSEPALAVAAAAALEAGGMDLGWQQLQAQNIMLLQPLGNPVDDVAATMADHVLLPASTVGLVEERQRQALQMPCGSGSAGPGCLQQQQQARQYPVWQQLPAPSPQVQQLLQQQQAQAQQRQLAAAAQQQHWWAAQQPQQVASAGNEAAMVLLLSARQLAAMPQVLQEVARMTGAKACLTGAADGSVQLLLTGRLVEVQTAHSVAGMLLAKVGVDEPLLPAMPQRSH